MPLLLSLGFLKPDLAFAIIEKGNSREVDIKVSAFLTELTKYSVFHSHLPIIQTFDEIYLVYFHLPGF